MKDRSPTARMGSFIRSGSHALFVLDFAEEAGERRNIDLYIVLLSFRSWIETQILRPCVGHMAMFQTSDPIHRIFHLLYCVWV
jgi:hypothetical protein